jgi:hypothetical protein
MDLANIYSVSLNKTETEVNVFKYKRIAYWDKRSEIGRIKRTTEFAGENPQLKTRFIQRECEPPVFDLRTIITFALGHECYFG